MPSITGTLCARAAERRLGVDVLPQRARPVAIEARRHLLERSEAPAADRRRWWFLHEDGATQLCLENPRFEVDAYLSASLPDRIRIVRGDLTLHAALEQERLDVVGPGRRRRWLPAWLNLSPLAAVRSQRDRAKTGASVTRHAPERRRVRTT
jgi:hypothetical protein